MFGSALLFLVSMFSSSAQALSCLYGPYKFIPKDNTKNIPINAKPHIWYATEEFEESTVILRNDKTNKPVATRYTNTGINAVLRIEPDENLLQNTSYSIIQKSDDGSKKYTLSTFTTGSDVDTIPPATTNVASIQKNHKKNAWGSWKNLEIALDSYEENTFYKVEVSERKDFSDSELSYIFASGKTFSIGRKLCYSNLSMDPSKAKWIKVSVIDAAGNMSSETKPFEIGCRSTSHPIHMLLTILSVPLIAFRRRDKRLCTQPMGSSSNKGSFFTAASHQGSRRNKERRSRNKGD